MAPDGSFTYTPSTNYHGDGADNSFTYTLYEIEPGGECTGNQSDTATVEITVNSVNDAPSASADSFLALRNTTLNISAPGVLSNDSDIDGDALTAVMVNNATHGVVVLAANGPLRLSYTLAAEALGFGGRLRVVEAEPLSALGQAVVLRRLLASGG